MRQTAAVQSLKSSRVRDFAETDHILRDKMSFEIPPFAIRSFYVSVTWCTNSPSIYLQLQKVFELNLKSTYLLQTRYSLQNQALQSEKGGNHLSFAKNILWISLQLDMISIKSLLRVLTWSNAFNVNENYNQKQVLLFSCWNQFEKNFHFQNCA